MPQVNDPSGLSQGNLLIVSDAVWGTPTGINVTVTSVGANLPLMDDNEFIEMRNHPLSANNGLYRVNDAGGTVATAAILEKVTGAAPLIDATGRSIQVLSALDKTVADLVFANLVVATATTANRIDITSAGSNIPIFSVGERFEVELQTDADNNGAYEVILINTSTSDYQVTKLLSVAGGNANEPNVAALDSSTIITERKTMMWETQGRGWAVLEQGGVDATGANGQAVYSKAMIDWLDDPFLRGYPFPMRNIDKDAGKYLFGQDADGNNSGWLPLDDVNIVNGNFGIRTRKLLRNAGWNEIDSSGNITARRFGCLTVDVVENSLTDTAFGMFGTDTVVDNTFDLTFAGPVNEAVEFFKEQPLTSLAILGTTITRIGGSFITEGYKVGGRATIRSAEDAANNGTHLLSAVTATVLTTTGLTVNAADTTAVLAVDNGNIFRLGMRERDAADPNGSTFAQADLNSIQKSALGNFVFQFPLKTGTDLKIGATDAFMDANAPYTGMTLTMHSTAQSLGGSGILVGGPYLFGFTLAANNGTEIQCFEWLQYQLRKLVDIDANLTNIGRSIGLLARMVGEQLEVGSADGGTTQTVSPNGGGAGLFISGLNSASANKVTFFDSLGVGRVKPIAVSVTLDANAVLNGDPVSDAVLWYKNTIENPVNSTFVITAGTGSSGTFVSTAQFPATLNRGVNAYVEAVGLTGANAAMNGIYQVTALTSTSLWSVTRIDNKTIVTTTGEAASIDENPLNSPNGITVHTNVKASGTNISFTAGGTIGQTSIDGIFSIGNFVQIENSTSGLNDDIWEVTATPLNQLTVINAQGKTITTQAAGPNIAITRIVDVPMQVDFAFSFDYSNNIQGGRTGSTNAKVVARAVGRLTSQFTASTVQTITTNPLIIPLVAQGELNVTV